MANADVRQPVRQESKRKQVDSRSLRGTCSGRALALPGDGGGRVDPQGTMAGTNLTARERQILELIGTGSFHKGNSSCIEN